MSTTRQREGVRTGDITTSIRIWKIPHIKAGGFYSMEGVPILIEFLKRIFIGDLTGVRARQSGFKGVVDLLKVAKQGERSHV